MNLLTQAIRIKEGDKIEEAHMRNRALIANWVLEHYSQAVQLVKKDGKTYVQITDYPALRHAFADLLAEIQRIKSEGDFDTARILVSMLLISIQSCIMRSWNDTRNLTWLLIKDLSTHG